MKNKTAATKSQSTGKRSALRLRKKTLRNLTVATGVQAGWAIGPCGVSVGGGWTIGGWTIGPACPSPLSVG
jgi:hypothetical protein